MKNTIKVLCIIAVVTMISLSMTACDEGFDNTPKYFTLTGIPSAAQSKMITVAIAKESGMASDRKSKLHAYNYKTPNAATISDMPLLTARDGANNGDPYQGSGSDFFLFVFVDSTANNSPSVLDDDDVYYYSGGGGGIIKFNIKYGEAKVEVDWNQLTKQQ